MSSGKTESKLQSQEGEGERSSFLRVIAYGVAIFGSAFLLFEIEPQIAKLILPWFGGAASVWLVCLLFFQIVLLAGYGYAHVLSRERSRTMQGGIHLMVLAVSIFVLRALPPESCRPNGPEHPVLHILSLLCLTIGLPYFALSATSPLLQFWYWRASEGASPYRFYALSNIGSMLALLGYPILIEPRLSNAHQAQAWEVAYIFVAVVCGALCFQVPRRNSAAATASGSVATPSYDPPDWKVKAVWVALAACGSALLLSVTNHISQNIAAVPFLWILPLSLYLLSFILCFNSRTTALPRPDQAHEVRWYPREFFLRMLGISLGAMIYALSSSFAGLPWKVLILLYCAGLFVCCMFCHGELARLKPSPGHLTSFYLMISLGGALGAIFVALIAPKIFAGYYELEVSLGVCAILVLVVHYRDPGSRFYRGRWDSTWLVIVSLVAIVIVSLFVMAHEQRANTRLMVRNFYGVLRVMDEVEPNVVLIQGTNSQPLDEDPHYRKLMNGTIDHGLQYLAPSRRREPTTYYGRRSGIGVALRAAGRQRPLHVGAIGLGIGTVATYGRPKDDYTFYEINALDVKVANEEFTFLRDSEAKTRIVLGDARLSLENEARSLAANQRYDVLIVDAFSGDSIPVHLLTLEAFQLYLNRLKPDGILAVHISNQYLDLEPVVSAAAAKLDKEAVIVNHEITNSKAIYPSTWILIGDSSGFLGQAEIEKTGKVLPRPPNFRTWTDDYTTLWPVLK